MTVYNYWNAELFYIVQLLVISVFILLVFAALIIFTGALILSIKQYKNQKKKDGELYADNYKTALIIIVGLVILCVAIHGLAPDFKEKGRNITCLAKEDYITVEGDISVVEAVLHRRDRYNSGYRIVLTVGDLTLKPDNYFSAEAYNKLCSIEKAKVSYIVDGEYGYLYDIYSEEYSGEYLWTTDSTVLLIIEESE